VPPLFGRAKMGERLYCTIAGVIFSIAALVHLGRLCAGWDLVLAGWLLPVWLTWIAFFLCGGLGGIGLWFGSRGTD
jgi:hypothetical protein